MRKANPGENGAKLRKIHEMGSSTPNKACIFCGSVDNVILVNNERFENMPVCRRCIDERNRRTIKIKVETLENFCEKTLRSIGQLSADLRGIMAYVKEIAASIDKLTLHASKEPDNGENMAQDSHGKDDKSSEESIIS